MTESKKKRKNGHSNSPKQVPYAQNETENFLRVEMINFSRWGMCFESGYEVGPGARVKINKLDSRIKDTSRKENDGCLAEVKWCKPVAGENAYFYRVGVEYVEPVDPRLCCGWRAGDNICISLPSPTKS